MKISQVKSNIQLIITNLKQLQVHRDNLTRENLENETSNIDKCKQRLEKSLATIESCPVEKIVNQIQRTRKRHARRSARLKLEKQQKRAIRKRECECPPRPAAPVKPPLTYLQKKELQTANRYIETLISLETLHQLKGGGESCKLRDALDTVARVWKTAADEIIAESKKLVRDEAQWDEVLFGGSPEVDRNVGLKAFTKRRCIWDSYLVMEDDPSGSHIPIGWVHPQEDVRSEWKQYRA